MTLKTELRQIEYDANNAIRHPFTAPSALPKIMLDMFAFLHKLVDRIEQSEEGQDDE